MGKQNKNIRKIKYVKNLKNSENLIIYKNLNKNISSFYT